MLNIIFIGPPGSGKGTQSIKIAKYLNLNHINMGNILRSEIKNNSINEGFLLSDNIISNILREKIKTNSKYIFDGVPRNICQYNILKTILRDYKQKIDILFYIQLKKENIIERISKRMSIDNRIDDKNINSINNRINEFYIKTLPIIQYCQSDLEVHNINGNKSIDNVYNNIITIINNKLSSIINAN
ncbi:MAG: nucleoside monophosphate kinase [Bacteroides sp.]|nr:MAG: nucleoside monophosphate kinase [Bacteroides sp.]